MGLNTATYVTATTDPVTGGISLVAGGKMLPILKNRALSIIPFGDSITQSSSTNTGGLWQWSTGYAEASILASGARYQIIRNAGIGGNTTAQMLARIDADVLSYSPQVCLFMAGTNDLLTGMSNAAYASMFNNIEACVIKMLKAGVIPVIVTPPPKNGAMTETKNAQWFYYALAQYYDIPLIDTFRVLVNPATGNFAAGYSSDLTHPIAAGVTRMIAAASAVLSDLASAYCPPYLAAVSETNTNQFANLLANGAFANSSVPPTPNGWTVNATSATPTLVSATLPYTGNEFTYNKTGVGAAYALQGPNIGSSAFSVGDTIYMGVRLNVSGLTPATASGYSLALDTNSANLRMTSWVQNGDFIMAHKFVVPVGSTYFQPTLYVNDIALYKVSNWTAVNVTAANAIWQPGLQAI